MTDDEVVESNEDFEVYTRKPKRDTTQEDHEDDAPAPTKPRHVPVAPPVPPAPIDPHPPAYTGSTSTTNAPHTTNDLSDGASTRPRGITPTTTPDAQSAWFGQPQDPPPAAREHATPIDTLPDPPTEPMRVSAPDPVEPFPLQSSFTQTPPTPPEPAPSSPAATPSTPTPPTHPPSIPIQPPIPHAGDSHMRIAIAVTEFNYDITQAMMERARSHAEFLGATVSHIVHVPGVYDLPLAVKRLLRRDDVDGVVTLGVVIQGETDHDDLVIQHAARKIVDLSLEHDKPAGLGITGPGMSRMQAMARVDRAKEAVEAVVKLGRTLATV